MRYYIQSRMPRKQQVVIKERVIIFFTQVWSDLAVSQSKVSRQECLGARAAEDSPGRENAQPGNRQASSTNTEHPSSKRQHPGRTHIRSSCSITCSQLPWAWKNKVGIEKQTQCPPAAVLRASQAFSLCSELSTGSGKYMTSMPSFPLFRCSFP